MFEFLVDLEKSDREDGRMGFRGVASTTSLDRQRERVTPECMRKMAGYAGIIELRARHDGLTELGAVEKLAVEAGQLIIEGTLDPEHPEAARVYKRMQSGTRYGLSIGGKVTGAHWEFDKEAGERVRYLDSVDLDHIAVCPPGKAANRDSFLSALAKSAEDEGFIDPEDVEKAGARHSQADITALHDARGKLAAADKAIAGACGCSDCGGGGDAQKAVQESALALQAGTLDAETSLARLAVARRAR